MKADLTIRPVAAEDLPALAAHHGDAAQVDPAPMARNLLDETPCRRVLVAQSAHLATGFEARPPRGPRFGMKLETG